MNRGDFAGGASATGPLHAHPSEHPLGLDACRPTYCARCGCCVHCPRVCAECTGCDSLFCWCPAGFFEKKRVEQ